MRAHGFLVSLVASSLALSQPAYSAEIIGYDIANANYGCPPSNCDPQLGEVGPRVYSDTTIYAGGWSHQYTGSIVPTGSAWFDFSANYFGGSGTLNDGIIPAGTTNNQFFLTSTSGEFPVSSPPQNGPVITLYLDGFYQISHIDILSGAAGIGNVIPGNITGAIVTIGNNSDYIASLPFGLAEGELVDQISTFEPNDRLVLSPPLSSRPVDRLTLSGFTAAGINSVFFNIAEIQVQGRFVRGVGAVPEPATWMMMLIGFFGIGGTLRRRPNIGLQTQTS